MTRFERLGDDARAIIVESDAQARALRHPKITTGHTLLALLGNPGSPVTQELNTLGVTFEAVLVRYTAANPVGPQDLEMPQHLGFSPAASKMLDQAFNNTMKQEYPHYTDGLGLLLALAQIGGGEATEALVHLEIDATIIEQAVTRRRSQSAAA
jgi:ATP-dependent Clp protease ATP-binding subunit ClpA